MRSIKDIQLDIINLNRELMEAKKQYASGIYSVGDRVKKIIPDDEIGITDESCSHGGVVYCQYGIICIRWDNGKTEAYTPEEIKFTLIS